MEYLQYVSRILNPDLKSTILIQIPAYRDPELISTVNAALAMASNPERLYFSICLQDDDPEKLAFLQSLPRCIVKHFAEKDAPGLCAARRCCQEGYAGQDYVLHIDLHMRFAKHWDEAIIDQWRLCDDSKAIITDYPKPYTEEMINWPVDDERFTNMAVHDGNILNAFYFCHETCEMRSRAMAKFTAERPRRGALIAGGCTFAKGEIDTLVLSDPFLDFTGDEISMAVRYYTHGFNFYHMCYRFIYHLYYRTCIYGNEYKIRPSGYNIMVAEGVSRHDRQNLRLEKLLGRCEHPEIDLGEYGLGTARTVAEYERFSGVDFKRLLIRNFAALGFFDVEHNEKEMGYFNWREAFRACMKKYREMGEAK